MFSALGEAVPPLGMGCASLGSRVSPAAGLRALAEAFERDVIWCDVAPAYGAGEAEVLLGRFAAGRRDGIRICTKVGLAPPERGAAMRLVQAAARPLAGAVKGLRKLVRRTALTRNRPLELTPGLVRASLERSLRRMGVGHVDVFALHDPLPGQTRREDIRATLEDLRAAGHVRALAVAGDFDACAAGLEAGPPFTVAQLADPPGAGGAAARLRAAVGRRFSTVTHSVLGVGGAAETLARRLAQDAGLRVAAQAHGFDGPPARVAVALLLRRAFTLNADGVVLMSMFSRDHLADALAAAAAPPLPAPLLDAVEAACAPATAGEA
jgi:aryl-alcohol dehydrogenase-like predicted oxidoreductase